MSPEQKYAVAGVHHDQFNIDLGDGKPDGPGPGHYRLEREAFLGAANWIWVFAEANDRRKGGRGHDHEWDAFIFLDRSSGKYGFTTPEVHCRTESSTQPQHGAKTGLARLRNERAEITGYIHSHPKGVMGTAPEVFSGIITDEHTGEVSGDRLSAYELRNHRWWLGLLTPKGSVQRIRLTTSATAEVNRLNNSSTPNESILKILRSTRPGVWEVIVDRPQQGHNWMPGAAVWREKAVAAAASELRHLPQGVRLRDVPAGTCPDPGRR